jgi:hypothetical protein
MLVAADLRNLLPAIGDDVAAQISAPFRQIESALKTDLPNLNSLVNNVDFGIATLPDLTKIIPQIATGALGPNLAALDSQARAAASQVSMAVNTTANQGIAAASDAAKSRVRNLIG